MRNIKTISIFLFCLLLFLSNNIQPQTDSLHRAQQEDTVSQTTLKVQVTNTEKSKADNKINLAPPTLEDLISVQKILWSVLIFIIGIYLNKLITKILELFAERSAKYRITIKGFIPVIRILGWTFIFYIIIHGIFSPPAETIIAILASLGIAVGFAAQDIFKNIFGGITILFDRPFQVGDKIEIGEYYGEVIKIGLRSTKIITPDDSMVTVPNSDLMNKSVSNSNTGEPNCQVVAELYLPADIDTEKVRKIATEAAQVSRYIYLNKPITVLFFHELKQDRTYLKMRLKAYVMDIRYEFTFKSDMTELVMRELYKEGIIKSEKIN
jgi:small-conductance mechanosensitive channel